MTLALYGKSKRRKGALLFTGFFAIMVAMLIGLASMGGDSAKAATSGTLVSPTTSENSTCSNAANAQVVGGTYTSCTNDEAVTYAGFNYAVPAGSVVTGVEVQIVQSTNNDSGTDGFDVSVHNGTSFSSSRDLDTNDEDPPPSDTDTSGGNNDLWGLTWDATAANSIKVRLVADTSGTMYLDSVQVRIYYTAPIVPPVATVQGPNITGKCTALDIHLVVDNSGSIGSSNMNTLISELNGATGFIQTIENGAPGTNWNVTKFAGTNTASSNGWATDLAGVTGFISGMSSSGGTPTPKGIQTAIGQGTNGPLQNLMIIVTDGAPNVTLAGGTGDFTGAAAEAVAQADAARSAGWTTMVAAIGAGDGDAPGGANGPWSVAVNQAIAGLPGTPPNGSVVSAASFSQLAQTLLGAIAQGCERNVIVGKVYDPTEGAPQDGTTFSGFVDNTAWSGVGFGLFSGPIANLALETTHTVVETSPNDGWHATGYILGSLDQAGAPQCPAYNAQGWLQNGTNIVPALPVNTAGQAVVCIKNTKTANPVVNVAKAHSGDGIYNLGESFDWTITATVTNPPTTADYAIYDAIPSQFTVNSVTETDSNLTCNSANPVACTLTAGAGAGPHTITINVTVKNDAVCGLATNNVLNGVNSTAGPIASDEVSVTGCGTVTLEKSDTTQTVDSGANIQWTIALDNPSAIAMLAQVNDANATLVSSTGCISNATQAGGVGTTISCDVPAGNAGAPHEATITVKTPSNATVAEKCQGYIRENTATLVGGNSDGATARIPGDPSQCNRDVTVCKVVVGNGDGVTHAAFGYGFDIRPTGLGNISDSNSVAEPADNSESTAVCKTKQVPTDKAFDVVEHGARPADFGGWTDAAGYPQYAIGGGSRITNNTTTQIAAGTTPVTVTFYNKATPITARSPSASTSAIPTRMSLRTKALAAPTTSVTMPTRPRLMRTLARRARPTTVRQSPPPTTTAARIAYSQPPRGRSSSGATAARTASADRFFKQFPYRRAVPPPFRLNLTRWLKP